MSIKDLKVNFLSIFREFFVYHHRSLEFRAKFFAAMIAANPEGYEESYEVLRKICTEIYGHDEERIDVLVKTTKEYVVKIKEDNGLDLDRLIKDIDKIIRNNHRFVKKINLNHLRRLQVAKDEQAYMTQERIIEFAETEIL